MRPGDGTDEPHKPELEPDTGTPLSNAVERWRGRGYTVRYDDGLLVQLSRRETPTWRTLLLLLLALGAVGLGLALFWLAWRSARRWSVVSLTQGPDQRIITHRQLTDRPPTDEEPESE